MCRSGLEDGGGARRCALPAHLRAAHNAVRMMTRIAAALESAGLPTPRRDRLRDDFVRHCNRLRDARGMGEGTFPPVPTSVSLVSVYATSIDSLPYEIVAQRADEAAESGDWLACELLSLEVDRRGDIAAHYPAQLDAIERERLLNYQRSTQERHTTDNPVHFPAARAPMTAKQAEMAERAAYEGWIESEILRAEEACNGVFFNKAGVAARLQGKACTPRTLWANQVFAQAYASEELRRYWLDHPRVTFTAWQMMQAGNASDAATAMSTNTILTF